MKTEISGHAHARIIERIVNMTNCGDISHDDANNIKLNLNLILNHEFDYKKSYGIMLGRFNINPNSRLMTDIHKSGIYYVIYSMDCNDIIKDSTGNELWCIIRYNKIITAFLRKTVQRKTACESRNAGGLGVDFVIDNIEFKLPL